MSLSFWVGHYGAAPEWVKMVLGPPVKAWDDLTYWFRRNFIKRYKHHVVYTDLKPGWYDIDYVMEAALVSLLRRYVEWELPSTAYDREGVSGADLLREYAADRHEDSKQGDTEFTGSGEHHQAWGNAYDEILNLYNWFVTDKPLMEKLYADHIHEWYEANRGRPLFGEPDDPELAKKGYKQMIPARKGNEHWEKSQELRDEIDKTTQKNLVRIVEMRGFLWT